jgi:hypothetical protein
MAFNVYDFRSSLQFDGARPNLFEVNINFPGFLGEDAARRQLTFLCKSAQLPGSIISPIQLFYFGREVKFSGNRTFQDWTVQIINDEDFRVRNAFERWMNALNSHQTNLRNPVAGTPNGYTADAVVNQYGKSGDIIKTYKFVGMFPVDVTQIDLDWGANDQIEEYAVSFAYQYWTAAGVTT